MRISIKAKPNSNEEKVEKLDSPLLKSFGRASDLSFIVSVKEPPVHGLANLAILKALREYFHTPNVRIVSGYTSRSKIIEIG
ncbi:MAG: hypothetical protein A3B86_04825 [Candidatus Yanofskybacteria bacterium RIFCSPHIGHO2_02_FULL_38_22b]|uniref:Uncharacterized protein n=1 Tax=Candidatus Yanofskybacteria bacterium RIFCSPHIGHO2_02_FULL_38_22b TaxID=1802673 RepID=A0A1F8F336_9BACT|nr:MAG: hypothetical protein A2816_01360 [Candidatus Yanofskybacteria bacterium RIFCSPHIGHO2_01_FULL_39_44]OGN07544.1 MAG: hypothetical protein A3B86_04825 [Candidatus Yanofskybacteria bacterium RIFCSPHIGHO2_02_FULL_38_22b]OGN20158.1 MAG: hypothetical protein A2910_02150 [Candidatus Yanofskybacteria bacterium RIFCSPLOWO2_01_FULL_39_28]